MVKKEKEFNMDWLYKSDVKIKKAVYSFHDLKKYFKLKKISEFAYNYLKGKYYSNL